MSAEIYYFTASGHSLVIARNIAGRIGADLTPIPLLLKQEHIPCQADVIGLVFPVYHATFGESGIPHLVMQFIEKLDHLPGKYVFGVCTHSGFPGLVLENLAQRIAARGGVLAAGFTVQLHVPYTTPQKMSHEFFHQPLAFNMEVEKRKRQKKTLAWQQKLETIVDGIQNRESNLSECPGKLQKGWLRPFMALQKQMAVGHFQRLTGSSGNDFWALTLQADRSFKVNERCAGCGTCVNVCPVGNIELVDGEPHWLHHCENCTACFHWCPKAAIEGEIVGYEKRIQPDGITLKDILRHAGTAS